LLRRRIARLIEMAAIVTWVLLALTCVLVTRSGHQPTIALLNAEVAVRSVHFSLGAVVAFILTIWITLLLSRFLRFVLQEEIYDRFHLARGPAYAVSTLVHYGVLLVGFYIAIAALGADMTKVRYPGRCVRCRHRLRSAKCLQ
jgi:Small-conductance mechanosensitive channel